MLYCLGQPFKKTIDEIPKAETKYIEIVDDGTHALNKQRVSMLKDLGGSYDLRYTVHAPFAGVNIALPSKPLLNAILRRLKQSIINTSVLNAQSWVFHPGMKTGISMFYPGMDWVRNLENVKLLVKFARDHSVEPILENVIEPFLMKNVDDFKRFHNESDEDVRMVLDTGHANISGGTENFLMEFSDKIVHIHAHDNDGKRDQHLGLGRGTVNWKNFADLVKKIPGDCIITAESVEYIKESLEKIKSMIV
jgi:sugar phosphate isomerase/epimerase